MVYKKRWFIIGMVEVMLLLCGCSQVLNATVGTDMDTEETSGGQSDTISYDITDWDRRTEFESEVKIDLNVLNSDSVDADNYFYDQGCLTINEGGDYIITGKSNECRIVVNVYDDENVHLVFDDAELHTESGPAVLVEKAGKVIITSKDRTENVISDGTEYASSDEACIFSNCDLTINGNGTLNVFGYYHDAIRSKDRIKVVDSRLIIKAKNDGIRGNDGVIIENSDIEIESEGNGLLANSEKGFVSVSGGSCKIISGENAIYANNYVLVKNCEKNLYSVKEAIRCNGQTEMDGDNTK